MTKKKSPTHDSTKQNAHDQYLENFKFSPGMVNEAWERLEKQRRAIVAGASSSTGKGGGADDDELRSLLSQIETARHALLTAVPVHFPLVRMPADPRPELKPGPAPRPGLVYQRTFPPFISKYDDFTLDQKGVFDFFAESPVTDPTAGLIGSNIRATAMSGSVADFTSVQYVRDSGVMVHYDLKRPTQLAVSIDLRLRSGWGSALFNAKHAGDVYCSIYEYHLPFMFMVPPIPAVQIFSEAFPGHHGLQFFWSKTGGMERSFSTPPADAAWDFRPFRLVGHTSRLEPADFPDGVNFIIGMQHRVHVLAQFVRFDVDSGGHWAVDFVDVIEV